VGESKSRGRMGCGGVLDAGMMFEGKRARKEVQQPGRGEVEVEGGAGILLKVGVGGWGRRVGEVVWLRIAEKVAMGRGGAE